MEHVSDRNRERTQNTLIEAVGGVIDDVGVTGLGVNAVAKKARVDKALIYRYFGGLDGLVEAFARSEGFWPTAEEILGDGLRVGMRFDEQVAYVFRRYVGALRKRPRTLAILGSEMLERSPLHGPLERVREEMGLKLMATASDVPPGVDVPALATLLTGALHYLLARSRFIQVFNGIRLDDDAGWERILGMLGAMTTGLMRGAEINPGAE
jgi:AcrR family transcriptional regulator